MKKTTRFTCTILILALLASMLCSCGKKEEPKAAEEPTEPVGPIVGGWTVDDEFTDAQIPEEAKEALAKALEGLDGAAYEPVAYLGSQVVAGINYALLCKITPVAPDAESHLSVVKVYKNLEGGAEILSTEDVDVAEYTEGEDVKFPEVGMAGAFTFKEASGSALGEKEKAAFDKAMAGLTGVGYEPLACLGHQVVSGTNYAVLCKATRVTEEPAVALAVVVIYEDLQGEATVRSISGFTF